MFKLPSAVNWISQSFRRGTICFLLMSIQWLGAQTSPIFRGGEGDGSASAVIMAPIPDPTFFGGRGDGYSSAENLSQAPPMIFVGGSGDGSDYGVTALVAETSIFEGGAGDGSSSQTLAIVQTVSIFGGGTGDGFDSLEGSRRPYDVFMASAGLFGSDANPLLDYDQDSWDNLQEFAFGGHPAFFQNQPGRLSRYEPVDGEERFLVIYPRRAGGSEVGATYFADGVTYQGEGSDDLSDWGHQVEHVTPPVGLPALPAGYEYGALRITGSRPRGFVRIGVELP